MIDQYTAAELVGIHDVLKRIAAFAQQTAEPQPSIQIEQAAKPSCPPRITVKTYTPTTDEAAAIAYLRCEESSPTGIRPLGILGTISSMNGGQYFTIERYIRRGLDDRQDLIVMRKKAQ